MLNLIVRYQTKTNRGLWATAGHRIEVYWDDAASAFVVYDYDDPLDTTPTTRTISESNGIVLGALDIDYNVLEDHFYSSDSRSLTPKSYKFCDGANLQTFEGTGKFPFAYKKSIPGHFSCALNVCDLQISDDYTIDDASSASASDGGISVVATSSNPPVKYSLDPNFRYHTQGQLTGVFTGLPAGDYTVTVRDALGCFSKKVLTVGIPITYGVYYRQEYNDKYGRATRTDILERGFGGAPTEVRAGNNDPVVIRYNLFGELNRFKSIVPSQLSLCLMSESNFQFRRLFSQDERKYQVKHYKDFGSGLQLVWQGFIISSNYSEAYTKAPYAVTVVATDGLEDLKKFDWLDTFGNKFIDEITPIRAIASALSFTDQNFNIQSAVNRFEEEMDSDVTDDPLSQCTFNPKTYYFDNETRSCYEAIDFILKSFGARILQRDGKWFIYCVEEAVGEMPYREFSSIGEYVSEGTIDDVQQVKGSILANRAVFTNRDQTLEVLPSYGKMFFEHTLLQNASLVESHGFEEEDLISSENGDLSIRGWNINISNHAGAAYGIKKTKALEGSNNFYVKRSSTIVDGINEGVVVATSKVFPIEYDATDLFEFKFDYAIILGLDAPETNPILVDPLWVKMKWMLKVGSHYYNEQYGGWTNDADKKYNDVFCFDFNDAKNFRLTAFLRKVTELTLEDAQVEFVFTFDTTVDVIAGLSEDMVTMIKAIPTADLTPGYRIKAVEHLTNASGETKRDRYYILAEDDAADLGKEVIRPSDYLDSTSFIVGNEVVWKLEQKTNTYTSHQQENVSNSSRTSEANVEYVYLDNVILRHLPKGEEPPANITIEKTANTDIKLNFEDQYLLNDIDIDNINNSERTYINFLKRMDGNPTQLWTRTYRAGTDKLLALLSNDFANQYRLPSNKITGSMHTDVRILPSSILEETGDGGKPYMFMGYELHDKGCNIFFDLSEIKNAIADPDSDDIYADFNTDFSLDLLS